MHISKEKIIQKIINYDYFTEYCSVYSSFMSKDLEFSDGVKKNCFDTWSKF